jgi:hypothetical protein
MTNTKIADVRDYEVIGDILNTANGEPTLVTIGKPVVGAGRERWKFAGRRRNESAGHDYYAWHLNDWQGLATAVFTIPVADMLGRSS